MSESDNLQPHVHTHNHCTHSSSKLDENQHCNFPTYYSIYTVHYVLVIEPVFFVFFFPLLQKTLILAITWGRRETLTQRYVRPFIYAVSKKFFDGYILPWCDCFSVPFPRLRILAVQWRRLVVSLTIIPTNQITVIVMFPWKQKPDNREISFLNLFVFCA